MSQWHNPAWHNQQSPPANYNTKAPPKDQQYTFTLPTQANPRHAYIPGEFESTSSGQKGQFANRGSPPLIAQGCATALPAQRGKSGMVGQALYVQMPMQQFVPPEINNYNTSFQIPADQWEQPGLGMRPKGGITEQNAGHKGVKRDSIDETGSSDLSSRADNEQPEARSRQGSSAGQKVTKRSRMGCLTCRQRKKRCCETRPKCTECQRLRLNCVWPKPGTEHKNKPKEVKSQENMIDHDVYGKIKVLRGIVEYRSN